jgi:hypothetical protein
MVSAMPQNTDPAPERTPDSEDMDYSDDPNLPKINFTNTNPSYQPEYIQAHAQSLRQTLNRLIIMAARVILVGLLLNLIIQAFVVSSESGVKSLAAAILPLLIAGYISFSSKSRFSLGTTHEIVDIIFYILSGIWMIFLLVLARYAVISSDRGMPLGEVAISVTFSIFMLITGRIPFKTLVACAYGIISGLLIYVLIFGIAL